MGADELSLCVELVRRLNAALVLEAAGGVDLPVVYAPVNDEERLPERWGLLHFVSGEELVPGNGTVRHEGELSVRIPAGLEGAVGSRPDAVELVGVLGAVLGEVLEELVRERRVAVSAGVGVYVYDAVRGRSRVEVADGEWQLVWGFTLAVQY